MSILGVELNRVVIGVNSAHRVRKQHCEDVEEDVLNRFSEEAKAANAPLAVHFDGQ